MWDVAGTWEWPACSQRRPSAGCIVNARRPGRLRLSGDRKWKLRQIAQLCMHPLRRNWPDYARFTQVIRKDYADITQQLRSDYAKITQALRNDYASITQRLRKDYAIITQSLRNHYAMIMQSVPKAYADITHRLRRHYAVTRQALRRITQFYYAWLRN